MSRVFSLVAFLASAYFLFYTVRLYSITRFLTDTGPAPTALLVAAFLYPALGLLFGWLGVRYWIRGRSSGPAA